MAKDMFGRHDVNVLAKLTADTDPSFWGNKALNKVKSFSEIFYELISDTAIVRTEEEEGFNSRSQSLRKINNPYQCLRGISLAA